ncbi:MAG: YitT family protein [Oscillospiraceae bacterium]|nr:YitT family protein [Oscillospiraceae bacterium]
MQTSLPVFSLRRVLLTLAGSAILAFGLYHVHSFSGVTEGGVLGAVLLIDHHFGISPAVSGAVMNALCYAFGAYTLGLGFVLYSVIAGGGFSIFYAMVEQMPPLWPQLAGHPAAAALLGALFVGIGTGLSIRAGGAPSGDDSLAMALQKLTGANIERVYLVSDLAVLLLSLSYIPARRLVWSLLTVVLSGRIIGIVQRAGSKQTDVEAKN